MSKYIKVADRPRYVPPSKSKSEPTVEQIEAKLDKKAEPTVGVSDLAAALVQAINSTKPVEKKNRFSRTALTPWTPKDGSKKLKFKRKAYQHGRLVNEETCSNEEIALFNKIRPGRYCDGHVVVIRRKDRGIDIDYAIKTASQRLKLVNQFGIRNFKELLERVIMEAEQPARPQFDADGDAL
jgi:hypothetical protein